MKFEQLKERIYHTLSQKPIGRETVIRACHALSAELLSGVHDAWITNAVTQAEDREAVHQKIREAARILSREYLEAKVSLELGRERSDSPKDLPPHITRMPLGVLFHIGAGNMEALPAYSVIEGLLAGNINLLKLPESDTILSRTLLRRLAEIEPSLKPYLYVFGFSSAETGKIKRLATLADAIVIWGGDEAVLAVRRLAEPSCRIIEWGHKISFAYVTMQGMKKDSLKHLARHMLDTDQTLCSSCQGIYLDTEDDKVTEQFCREFSRILEAEERLGPQKDIGYRARNTLRVCNSRLEASAFHQKNVYSQGHTSVTWEKNPRPESSLMFGNCWVKNLKKESVIRVLREASGYLQTVVLICGEEEWDVLSNQLYRAGAVHIRRSDSLGFCEEPLPHDGDYPLLRYSRYVV